MIRFVIVLALVMTGATAVHADAPDYVTAEIRGTLTFESGRGYYVAVKTMRVWLRISEDKIRARQLDSLARKTVIVRGPLHQMEANTNASVPPLGLYLDDFTIEPGK